MAMPTLGRENGLISVQWQLQKPANQAPVATFDLHSFLQGLRILRLQHKQTASGYRFNFLLNHCSSLGARANRGRPDGRVGVH